MQTQETTSPHQAPRDELLLALGRLVFEFGLLDEALHDALWIATARREDTRILTSGLRFPELVDRFEALYAGFSDSSTGLQGVRGLCSALRTLNADRNREVHAVWGFWAESGRPLRMQHRLKRGAMALSMESVEPTVLQAIAERMTAATDKVWEIALDFEQQRQRANLDVLLTEQTE